ncbi:ABC transporter substrate-binding protein [Streptomyces sp. TS71-3]|uniref:ABC transporter substrate-binding protein n=1 Tax=Streptomyces sp. TS71-3 TaxID=2733862 RepID=UPI001B2CE6F2|nr:ABC transporter substrate-binding protein [Streptomyces sp. TS71-3]GHJ41259.1 ABC transporter substrate-binding protein [Streptomyces sp. TS71-3]
MYRHAGAAVLAAVLVLSGCSSGTRTQAGAAGSQTVALSDCGQRETFSGAPKRAVTVDQASTETLLALGLADRMAGTSYLKTKVAPEYEEDYRKVPVLSKTSLTGEQVRAANPDVVVGGSPDLFTADRVGARKELDGIGLPSYVSLSGCPPQDLKGKTAFDLLLQDYRNLGRIFHVEDRADRLIADQRKVLTAAESAKASVTDKPSVVWLYSVFNGAPYVAGKGGIPSAMSTLLGVRNAFDDVDQTFPQVSWEAIAKRKPDVIVLGDLSERGAPGDTVAEKRDMLGKEPAVSQLDAVRHERYITVPGIEMDPSVRSVHALRMFIDGMRKLGYVH